MDFGLGLVLSFTDNATSGINSAVNSLTNLTQVAENAGNSLNEIASLSAFSSIATSVGNSMTSIGTNIISTFGQIIGKVNATGQTLMYAESQLSKLYEGSGKTGKDVLADITQYAKTSIFEFEDLIPVVTMLKANGIEAFDMIASSTGNANQTLMDYAADLAAFNPQMKNAYGTGIKAAMGALNEYIAEGNAMSLKRGASLDITGLLGEEKGATIEERSRQVADLMEKLNMVGMTAQLAQSPMTKLSNMSDTLFQFIGMISQSGVYDAFNEIIDVFSSFVMSIDDSTLQNVASIVGDALSALLKPVQQLAQWIVKLADGFIKLVENNSALAKFATIATAIAGVILVVGGVALKFAGSIGYLTLMLKSLSTSFGAIGTVMKAGATKILGALVPVTLALGVMYLVWKNDLFGIRTLVTSFVQNVVNSFNTAKTAVSGSLSSMKATLKTFDTQNSFFDGLTLAIMKVMVLFKALAESWNTFTLSEDTFNKAKELGILPLIQAILDIKYRFDLFKQGFIDGWQKISEKVKEVVNGLSENLDGTIFQGIIDKVSEFLGMFSNSDTQIWYDLGQNFADISSTALTIGVALTSVFSIVKKISSVVTAIGGIGSVLKPIIAFISANPAVAVIVGIVALLTYLITQCEDFRNSIVTLGQEIYSVFMSIAEPLKEGVMSAIIQLKPVLDTMINSLVSFLPQLVGFFSKVGGFLAGVLSKVIELALKLLPSVLRIVTTVFGAVMRILPLVLDLLDSVFSVVSEFIFPILEDLLDMAVPFITQVVDMLTVLVDNVLNIIISSLEEIVPVITNMIDLIVPMLKDTFEALMPIVQTILDLTVSLLSHLIPVIQDSLTIAVELLKPVISLLAPLITIVVQIVQILTTVLVPILNVLIKIIGTIIVVVAGVLQIVSSVITSIITIISGLLSVIFSVITAILSAVVTFAGTIVKFVTTYIITPICDIIGGIVDTVRTVWDGIVNILSGIIGFFTGIFHNVFSIATNVFQNIATFFSNVWNGIVETFNTLSDTISGSIKGAINKVLSGAVKIINGFIKAINFAVGIINAIPGVSISKITELSVPALAKGGVVSSPTTALIGEAGTEAVMPLENNTQWIGVLASMINQEMRNIRPTNTNEMNTTNNQDTTNRYLTTTNNNSNQTIQGDTDNSINFHEGSIQITVQNASEEEAMRLAKMIMEYIKRQKQLDRMMRYS